MSTFEQSRKQTFQRHFSVIEIDAPVVEGICTISGEPGFGTPLSCDQPSTGDRTYKFTQVSAPVNIALNGHLRLVTGISETTARLNSSKGLASRGTAKITFMDQLGKDPNPDAPAVTKEVIEQSSYMVSFISRNEFANKAIRIKNYRLEADGSIDLENGAETRHYLIKSVSTNKKGEVSFNCEDELSRVNVSETVWPLPLGGQVRADANSTQLTIAVDSNVIYKVGDTIRIGDELIKLSAVANIGTGTASVSTLQRGADIVYTELVSKTTSNNLSQGDEIFVCDVSDDERIDDLLERILLDIGIEQSFIQKTDWANEVGEWHPNTRINTLWVESEDTSDILEKILTDFLIDMWFDPVDRLIKYLQYLCGNLQTLRLLKVIILILKA